MSHTEQKHNKCVQRNEMFLERLTFGEQIWKINEGKTIRQLDKTIRKIKLIVDCCQTEKLNDIFHLAERLKWGFNGLRKKSELRSITTCEFEILLCGQAQVTENVSFVIAFS